MKMNKHDFFKKLLAAIGALLGTGAVGLAGYTTYIAVDTFFEEIGTSNPFGSTSAATSEGSVGELLSGLTVAPFDVTTGNPIGGTGLGVLGVGTGGVLTSSSSSPDEEVLVKDGGGNLHRFKFWLFKKDLTAYREIERRADAVDKMVHGKRQKSWDAPALVMEDRAAYDCVHGLLNGSCTSAKLHETLMVLEETLSRVTERSCGKVN